MPPIPSTVDLRLHDLGGPDQSGPPCLLLMHGLTDSGACWPDAAARWSPLYRVLAWDARGHGTSPRFTPGEVGAGIGETMRDDALDLLTRMRDLGWHPPVLVGHSMGGGTAAQVAANRPDLIAGAVLEDPALGLWPGQSKEDRVTRARTWLADARSWREDPAAAEAQERRRNPGWPPSEYEPWARAKTQVDEAVFATGLVAVERPAPELVREIAVPTLLITAEHDTLLDPLACRLVETIGNPHVEHHVVPGSGHCVRRTRPDAYHALVGDWLGRLFPDPVTTG